MKKAPCVRLASRIKPKISEKPDDSRNNRPPSDRLLRPWMIQNCIVCRSRPESCALRCPATQAESLLQVLCRRIVARIDRIFQECGLVIGPELADIRVGLDDRVDQPPIFSGYLANIDVADGIAEFVEFDDATHRVRVAAAVRRHHRFLVLLISFRALYP